ncbi:uncharacterized protein ASCRUDRAFT_77514 [Ascoidea rubescens DSM 1968]|uniref:Velvet domain-containing protein n=1 Tax=Ascoidea rubescens DSM 1968 TaxID=1344418 RepID=A0A1D2VAN7_9ASCO|nr:hypothetical protein ASCRUDRAFT_77514 [Ascoidea rubescens DSM 1968]ODV58766.1 hypothetical protein ASCRUDRAFT_77514 [Ascoidea rubescens DSM 1968]
MSKSCKYSSIKYSHQKFKNNINYVLKFITESSQGRECYKLNRSKKLQKRLLNPKTEISLEIVDLEMNKNISINSLETYYLTVSLLECGSNDPVVDNSKRNFITENPYFVDPENRLIGQRVITGELCNYKNYYKFDFKDLCITKKGNYNLLFSLFKINQKLGSTYIKSIQSGPIMVLTSGNYYSAENRSKRATIKSDQTKNKTKNSNETFNKSFSTMVIKSQSSSSLKSNININKFNISKNSLIKKEKLKINSPKLENTDTPSTITTNNSVKKNLKNLVINNNINTSTSTDNSLDPLIKTEMLELVFSLTSDSTFNYNDSSATGNSTPTTDNFTDFCKSIPNSVINTPNSTYSIINDSDINNNALLNEDIRENPDFYPEIINRVYDSINSTDSNFDQLFLSILKESYSDQNLNSPIVSLDNQVISKVSDDLNNKMINDWNNFNNILPKEEFPYLSYLFNRDSFIDGFPTISMFEDLSSISSL